MINHDEADQLIDFIFGMLRPPDAELNRGSWRSSLAPLDAEVASQALINGAQVWEFFPSWKQFMQEYSSVEMRRGESSGPVTIKCRTCQDMGWVLAHLSFRKQGDKQVGPFDEYAPCPDCEVGKAHEARLYPRGYWQGRDTSHLRAEVDLEPTKEAPEWVARWQRARRAGDRRPFPEQAGVLNREDRPATPVTDKDAWVQTDEYVAGGHA